MCIRDRPKNADECCERRWYYTDQLYSELAEVDSLVQELRAALSQLRGENRALESAQSESEREIGLLQDEMEARELLARDEIETLRGELSTAQGELARMEREGMKRGKDAQRVSGLLKMKQAELNAMRVKMARLNNQFAAELETRRGWVGLCVDTFAPKIGFLVPLLATFGISHTLQRPVFHSCSRHLPQPVVHASYFGFLAAIFYSLIFRTATIRREFPGVLGFLRLVGAEGFVLQDQSQPCVLSHPDTTCLANALGMYHVFWLRLIPALYASRALWAAITRTSVSLSDTARLACFLFLSSGVPGLAFCVLKRFSPRKEGTCLLYTSPSPRDS
eukprot:TRINITY_DN49518_c0_g1_i2.p1 TRINITY_DN49518_c0_g1~~TRINITY_DN49518_c0_g1_i2.p1  ORF type:complete len:334 (+),score=82.35 TRINITY_DN49518_c0_g1_i2:156-1157(+)